jgi:hypothetical protein
VWLPARACRAGGSAAAFVPPAAPDPSLPVCVQRTVAAAGGIYTPPAAATTAATPPPPPTARPLRHTRLIMRLRLHLRLHDARWGRPGRCGRVQATPRAQPSTHGLMQGAPAARRQDTPMRAVPADTCSACIHPCLTVTRVSSGRSEACQAAVQLMSASDVGASCGGSKTQAATTVLDACCGPRASSPMICAAPTHRPPLAPQPQLQKGARSTN